VVVSGQTLRADHPVGAGRTFCTLDGTIGLRDALRQFRSGRIVLLTAGPAYRCPAAPYEVAVLIDADLRRRERPVA